MKIQIDTVEKSIVIQDAIELKELVDTLEQLMPNGAWKEYKLSGGGTIIWSNPTIVKEYVPYQPLPWQWPFTPPQYPTVIYDAPYDPSITVTYTS